MPFFAVCCEIENIVSSSFSASSPTKVFNSRLYSENCDRIAIAIQCKAFEARFTTHRRNQSLSDTAKEYACEN